MLATMYRGIRPGFLGGTFTAAVGLAVVGLVWGSSAAQAQLAIPGLEGPGPAKVQPVKISARLVPAAGDKPVQLAITAEILQGWHIYSITQPPGGPVCTKIVLDADQPGKLSGDFQATPAPDSHPEPLFNNLIVETHEKQVTWSAPVELAGDNPQQAILRGKVTVQACSESNCLPPEGIKFAASFASNDKAPGAQQTSSASVQPAPPAQNSDAANKTYREPGSHLLLSGQIEVAAAGKWLLRIHAEPVEGYHVYALAAEVPKSGPNPTLIRLTKTDGMSASMPTASVKPLAKTSYGVDQGPIFLHKEPVDWTIELAATPDAKAPPHAIEGLLGFMTCEEGKSCDQPKGVRFSAAFPAESAGAKRVSLEFRSAKYLEVARLPSPWPHMEASAGVTPATPLELGSQRPAGDLSSLPVILLSALAGGLILNLMPCVLPVIGLKIFSFIEQAGESRRVALLLNLWYSAGIVAVFLALATAASAANLGLASTNLGWGEQFASTTFNIVMASIVFAMALSFLGVWEIPIPGFVGSGKSQELASREGAMGAFSKGVVTTLLATPCSGPLLGSVFGFTLSQPPEITYLVFGCIGLGMSLPYLLIGAFPKLVRFLPKPGAWMETFKQAMGFLLLGGVVFIFTFLKSDYVVPTFALLIGLWAGCWWIGRTPLYLGMAKLVRAYTIGGLVAAAVGWVSFTVLLPGEAVIPWQPFTQARLEELTARGNTVMVDFTADWCLTCKTNLKFAINRRDVAAAVERGNIVPLLADWTDGSDEIKQVLASLGSASIPVLAIFPAGKPHEPIVLRDLITPSQLLDALKKAGPSKTTLSAQR